MPAQAAPRASYGLNWLTSADIVDKADFQYHSHSRKKSRLEFVYERSTKAAAPIIWSALTDPGAMEPHLPGTAKVVSTGVNSYRVSMKISMGFLRPTVNADVQLSSIDEPRSFTIELSGKSKLDK